MENDEITIYLKKVSKKLENILGKNLLGVYLMGSGSLEDFRIRTSDIDILAVTKKKIDDDIKDRVAFELSQSVLPVPAAGLDFMIVTEETAQHPIQKPAYEFWFSTGATWPTEITKQGNTSEVLVFLALCQMHGKVLVGAGTQKVFAQVPYELLLCAFIDILKWHRTKILDDFHDPRGQYSVLNASRIWMYAKDKKLGSKAEGGIWVLAREPHNMLVKNALILRDGQDAPSPSKEDIDTYLMKVLNICSSHIS